MKELEVSEAQAAKLVEEAEREIRDLKAKLDIIVREGGPEQESVFMPQNEVIAEAKRFLGIGLDAPDEAILGELNLRVQARERLRNFLVMRTDDYPGDDAEEDVQDTAVMVMEKQPQHKPGVGIGVVCFQEGRILLGQRHPDIDGGGQWELPGGSLKWGESWEDAAIREVAEETGIVQLTNYRFLTAKEDYRPEDGKHNVVIFVRFDARGTAYTIEPEKSMGWAWYGLHSLPKGPMFPALRELLTVEKHLIA